METMDSLVVAAASLGGMDENDCSEGLVTKNVASLTQTAAMALQAYWVYLDSFDLAASVGQTLPAQGSQKQQRVPRLAIVAFHRW